MRYVKVFGLRVSPEDGSPILSSDELVKLEVLFRMPGVPFRQPEWSPLRMLKGPDV